MGGCEKILDDTTNWWPKNSNSSCNLKYWMTCLWCTFLTEFEVTNTVPYAQSAAGRLSTEQNLAASEDFARFNCYLKIFQQLLRSMSFKRIQNFNQNTVSCIECHVYKHRSDVEKYVVSAVHVK